MKQVPSCEFFPLEIVKTNVLGTDNVLTAAIDCGARKGICLSTDKAAYPINAMGIQTNLRTTHSITFAWNAAMTRRELGLIFV